MIALEAQIAEVRREIERRVLVGNYQVQKGVMTREDVDARILAMSAVLETLVGLCPHAPEQTSMFLGE